MNRVWIYIVAGFICAGCGQAPRGQNLQQSTSLYVDRTAPGDSTVRVALIPVDVSGAYALGSPGAKVVVVEFSDLLCPYCRISDQNSRALRDSLVASGRVRWIHVDFPIPRPGEHSLAMAVYARCLARVHGEPRFWSLRSRFLDQQEAWKGSGPSSLVMDSLAALDGPFNGVKLDACIRSQHERRTIQRFRLLGEGLRVSGTPTYFIGGLPYVGALDASRLQSMIATIETRGARAVLQEQGVAIVEHNGR